MKFGNRQQNLYDKFSVMARWMCEDIYRSIFCARANFLVAMGLFNYIEVIGSFITGPFEKNHSGNNIINKKGKKIEIKCNVRFNAFFIKMGDQYQKLLKMHPRLYYDLRCGLTHEYLIKRKQFCIYGCDVFYSENEIDNLKNPIDINKIVNILKEI